MKNISKIGIIGGSRFGLTLAEALTKNGMDVTLIEKQWEIIQSLAESPIRAIQGDAKNPDVLRDAGFADCDIAVIAIDDSLETATLATIHCKDLKIPRIIAKADTDVQGRVLSRVGADNVVYPDRDRAFRLAISILHRDPIDFFSIADGYSVAEVPVPSNLVGKTLIEGNVRQTYGLTVLAIRRLSGDAATPRIPIIVNGKECLEKDDLLVVFGSDPSIEALSK